ncbi:hypothetical protein H6F77_26150 [Microcoleus sp. FACHB-831]|uniref:hypothetical protein n=1 Tax=Microcoleus sp. FACHB-831 TaxID=2692827 RepID=UPI0019897DAB|nr:hypothetical protein [Microcoleus sp. FACHB-831]MBD1924522.1 hypothetical protein [Microcoleus sp. FACHB-831]
MAGLYINHDSSELPENKPWDALLALIHEFNCAQVKASGLTLNSNLENLIRQSRVEDVRYALKVVEDKRKQEVVKNPEGLFYRVLVNRR